MGNSPPMAMSNADTPSESGANSSQQKGVQSIHRAVSLLRVIAEFNEQGISLSKIARIANFKVSTTHRILSTLNSEGLIRFDPVSKIYHLGFELFTLGNLVHQFTIRDRFRIALEHIAKKTGDTVYLIIREGYDSLCIDRVEGSSPIRIVFDVGMRRPLGMGAGSLALFVFLSDEQVEDILLTNKRRIYDFNGMTIEDMKKLISLCRNLKYTLTEGVIDKGVTGVGVPIYNKQKDIIASISVTALSEGIIRKQHEMIAKLIKLEIKHLG